MKVRMLAPHQTIDGVEVEVGSIVDVENHTSAQRLVNIGYAKFVDGGAANAATEKPTGLGFPAKKDEAKGVDQK